MERIQSALEKARSRRGQELPEARSGKPRIKSESPREKQVAEAWDALKTFSPAPAILARNRVFTTDRGELSSHIDLLRTRTLLAMRDNKWNRMAVTSPNIGCGKTTTCLNLAFSIARQKEQRVLLIEMDLRKPGMLKTIGLTENAPQFTRVLRGREAPDRHLLRLAPNLAIGANRKAAAQPSELLQSSDLHRILDELERIYQPTIMIFDMPPMLVSDEVMGFVDNVDCVLLMAAAGISSIKEIDTAEKDLTERTNVLGVVLNKCRYTSKEYGYNYYNYG